MKNFENLWFNTLSLASLYDNMRKKFENPPKYMIFVIFWQIFECSCRSYIAKLWKMSFLTFVLYIKRNQKSSRLWWGGFKVSALMSMTYSYIIDHYYLCLYLFKRNNVNAFNVKTNKQRMYKNTRTKLFLVGSQLEVSYDLVPMVPCSAVPVLSLSPLKLWHRWCCYAYIDCCSSFTQVSQSNSVIPHQQTTMFTKLFIVALLFVTAFAKPWYQGSMLEQLLW